ncbi:hypothetical protein GCN78_27130 [Janthinobacterium rivuli]|nr:hypothetical protein GCN78_27130 [Janthinobacterium sp. FT68W]
MSTPEIGVARVLCTATTECGRLTASCIFLGQLTVDGYFHDEAAVYVFYDTSKNECRSILQTC